MKNIQNYEEFTNEGLKKWLAGGLIGASLLSSTPSFSKNFSKDKEGNNTEISNDKSPFKGKEYLSDETHYRSVDSGESIDLSMAKKIALNKCKIKLSKDSGKEELNETKIKGEKVFQENGRYIYWICLEMPK